MDYENLSSSGKKKIERLVEYITGGHTVRGFCDDCGDKLEDNGDIAKIVATYNGVWIINKVLCETCEVDELPGKYAVMGYEMYDADKTGETYDVSQLSPEDVMDVQGWDVEDEEEE